MIARLPAAETSGERGGSAPVRLHHGTAERLSEQELRVERPEEPRHRERSAFNRQCRRVPPCTGGTTRGSWRARRPATSGPIRSFVGDAGHAGRLQRNGPLSVAADRLRGSVDELREHPDRQWRAGTVEHFEKGHRGDEQAERRLNDLESNSQCDRAKVPRRAHPLHSDRPDVAHEPALVGAYRSIAYRCWVTPSCPSDRGSIRHRGSSGHNYSAP